MAIKKSNVEIVIAPSPVSPSTIHATGGELNEEPVIDDKPVPVNVYDEHVKNVE